MEEIRCNLDKPRLVPYKNTWMLYQNTVYWCNLKLAQKKGLQFYQTRSQAIVLYNTQPAICIEKAVCMKTQEELYNKVYQSPRLPRVKLKPNSQSGQQDQPHQEARASSDHQSVSGSCGETHSSSIDCSPTTGDESHRNSQAVGSAVRESPAQGVFPAGLETDLRNKCVQRGVEEVDHRHGQDRDLRASKTQCPDCASYWQIGTM